MPENENVCPECGCNEGYPARRCNRLHCLQCGAAWDPAHGKECWIYPVDLWMEISGDVENLMLK